MTGWYNYKEGFNVAEGDKRQWDEFCKINQVTNEQENIITRLFDATKEPDEKGIYGCFCQSIKGDDRKYYDLTKNDFILIDVLVSQERDYLNYTRKFWSANTDSALACYIMALYAHIELHKGIADFGNNEKTVSVLQKIIRGVEAHSLRFLEKHFSENSSIEDFEAKSSHQLNKQPFVYGNICLRFKTLPPQPKTHRDLMSFRRLMIANKREKVLEVQLESEREVFRYMRHSIKNLVSGIQGPLRLLRAQTNIVSTDQYLKQALQGANFIADAVEAHSASYRNLDRKWRDDFLFKKQNGATPLETMFHTALHWAIPRLFYSEFNTYEYISKKYFADKDSQITAENEWYAAKSTNAKNEWLQKYLFDFCVDQNSAASELFVGNQYQTRIHLFILLNEIFMNAIKGIAESPREKRILKLCSTLDNNELFIKIINSASYTHSTANGIGNEVIQNYMHMFGAEDVKFDFISNGQEFLQKFSIVIRKEA